LAHLHEFFLCSRRKRPANQTTHDRPTSLISSSTTSTHIQYRQHAFDVHSRQPGQACLHLEEGHRRRGHKVCTPCSLLARRQVLEVRSRFSSVVPQSKRRNQKEKKCSSTQRTKEILRTASSETRGYTTLVKKMWEGFHVRRKDTASVVVNRQRKHWLFVSRMMLIVRPRHRVTLKKRYGLLITQQSTSLPYISTPIATRELD
jgi:hypothetical protein